MRQIGWSPRNWECRGAEHSFGVSKCRELVRYLFGDFWNKWRQIPAVRASLFMRRCLYAVVKLRDDICWEAVVCGPFKEALTYGGSLRNHGTAVAASKCGTTTPCDTQERCTQQDGALRWQTCAKRMPGLGSETADLASKELRERGKLNSDLLSPNCCGCGSLRSLCLVAKAQLCAVG